jgi:hypothetical protein
VTVLKDFGEWKSFLGERVEQAKKMGMDEGTIANVASQIGDYLSGKVDPKNNEERLLKELWDNADNEQQKTLASVMVNLVQKQ